MPKKRKTLEDYAHEGIDLRACIVDYTVLPHLDTLAGNSMEARVMLSFRMPDGTFFENQQVRRLKMKPENDE